MDVAANDVEAQLGNRKGRFWSDVGGVLGAVVAILWSNGRRRRVGGSDSSCAGGQAGRQWQVGFVGQQQCNKQKHSGQQRRPDDIHTRTAVSCKSEGESKHRQIRYG
jgi:hypothetical protein